jgi:hypothetical protein
MKKLILLLCLVASILSLAAQNRVHLRQMGRDSFYTSLEAAYNRAQDGDTIYLPGGNFSFPGDSIAKRIHIVGSGINLDSSKVTNTTIIFNITLTSNASGGSLTGIINGASNIVTPLTIGRNIGDGTNVNRYSIKRSVLQSGIKYKDGARSSNFLIQECYISYSASGCNNTHAILGGDNYLLVNNIIQGRVYLTNSVVKNNIFKFIVGLDNCGRAAFSGLNCVVSNNIFSSAFAGVSECNNSAWFNNYACGCNSNLTQGVQGANNYYQIVTTDSLFINAARNDYRLRPNYQVSYIGVDNTPIGLYGGSFPWKDGSMPFNPWIKAFNAAAQTDNTGRLRVQAEIKSQRD